MFNLNFNEKAKGVYKITNKINGNVYIGSSTINIKERWNKHCSHLRLGKHISKKMQDDYYKYGLGASQFEVLERMDNSSYDEIRNREQFYIEQYKSYGKNGYNSSSVVDGGNVNNRHIAVYDKDGVFIELLVSERKAKEKYKYTGVRKNFVYNESHDKKKISSIGLVFVSIDDVENVPLHVDVLEEKERIIVLYDIMNDCIKEVIGTNEQYLDYCEFVLGDRNNASDKIKNKRILHNTNGLIFCYDDEIDSLYQHHSDLYCLCCFDSRGNFLSKDFSKTYAGERYNLLPQSINSCSQSNNKGIFKRKMRTYDGYIFKHYKLSEIPSKINIINGEKIS